MMIGWKIQNEEIMATSVGIDDKSERAGGRGEKARYNTIMHPISQGVTLSPGVAVRWTKGDWCHVLSVVFVVLNLTVDTTVVFAGQGATTGFMLRFVRIRARGACKHVLYVLQHCSKAWCETAAEYGWRRAR